MVEISTQYNMIIGCSDSFTLNEILIISVAIFCCNLWRNECLIATLGDDVLGTPSIVLNRHLYFI